MRILWFPRLQADIDRFHRVTWRKMAEVLQEEGHTVRVAVAGAPEEENGSIPLPLWAFRGGRLLSFWILGRIAFSRELSRFRPDVVILDPFSFWFAFPTLLFRNRPLFVLDHRTPLDHDSRKGRGGAKLLARFLERISGWASRRFFDGITVITPYYRERLLRQGAEPERVGVWGSGVDTDLFDPARQKGLSRPPWLEGKFVLMQHGELSYNRGILEVVEILRKQREPRVALVLLGDGPARRELEGLAQEPDLRGRLFLLDPVPFEEVPSRLLWADMGVLLYPETEYWRCNHPLKLLEYLAMERSVLAGELFRPLDPQGGSVSFLDAASLASFLASPPPEELLRDRGLQGRRMVLEHWSWRAQGERLTEFLRSLSGRGKR